MERLVRFVVRALVRETGFVRRSMFWLCSYVDLWLGRDVVSHETIRLRSVEQKGFARQERTIRLAKDLKENGWIYAAELLDGEEVKCFVDERVARALEGWSKENGNAELSRNNYWKRGNRSTDCQYSLQRLLRGSDRLRQILFDHFKGGYVFRQWDDLHVPAGTDSVHLIGSQQWHCDNHHAMILKLFIACNDIGMESGPTCVLRKPETKDIYWKYHPDYMSDLEFEAERKRTSGSVQRILLRKYEAALINTSECLHMGGRSNKERHFIVITFTGTERFCTHWPRNIHDPLVRDFLCDVNGSF